MKRVLFFLLMIFVSFGVIADCEIQAKDHDCFTIFAKGTIFSAFPVLNNKAMWRWYQNEDIGEYYWQTELGTCKNNKFTPSGARLLIRVGSLRGFVNGMVASHLLCHSGTINRHSLNGALLS